MATKASTVEFLVEQMAAAGAVSARPMFGEYGIYCDGKMVAIAADDQLYVKPTAAGRAFIGKVDEAPPYPGAKNYFRIAGGQWDDGEWLAALVKRTAAELPVPVRKVARAKAPSKTVKKKSVKKKASAARKRT